MFSRRFRASSMSQREDCQTQRIRSQWPAFEALSLLNDYILFGGGRGWRNLLGGGIERRNDHVERVRAALQRHLKEVEQTTSPNTSDRNTSRDDVCLNRRQRRVSRSGRSASASRSHTCCVVTESILPHRAPGCSARACEYPKETAGDSKGRVGAWVYFTSRVRRMFMAASSLAR
jgi:hypothetical protein